MPSNDNNPERTENRSSLVGGGGRNNNKASFTLLIRIALIVCIGVSVFLPATLLQTYYKAIDLTSSGIDRAFYYYFYINNNGSQKLLPFLFGDDVVQAASVEKKHRHVYHDNNKVIAYAISITDCPKDGRKSNGIVDAPAILAHSIRLNSRHQPESGSNYDYQLYAFVHPDAAHCTGHLPLFNYTVQILETPVNASLIKKEVYRKRVQEENAGCCKEKEFLKLYSLTLEHHAIVVHLDLDTLLLKPLDPLFDAMMLPDNETKQLGSYAMWSGDNVVSRRIESFFTRDYPMGQPHWPTKHFGVQGGFWIVRPNRKLYDELRYLILEGNFSSGWYDGTTKYPGFYGAAMIQGLLGFHYGHRRPGSGIELNRCLFNNMADDPAILGKCLIQAKNTESSPSRCEDCRETNYSKIHSLHFTFCAKPWVCRGGQSSACIRFLSSWFQTRFHLETVASGVEHSLVGLSADNQEFYGYCERHQYTPINVSRLEELKKVAM
ncbi:hypothetical protein ACA910_005064 [Epithemia clementina (nom. ined.)]